MLFGHYTTAAALINILQTETLWASNIKFLNDEQEFLHALDLAKEVINRSKQNPHKFQSNKEDYEAFIQDATKALDNLDAYHAESIFTCSFSEEKDLLSQWRGYCSGNQGYCIHFDLKELQAAARMKFTSAEIFPCVYNNEEKNAKISASLNKHWVDYIAQADQKSRENTIRTLAHEIEKLASHFKHPSFAEEKEHRLVIRTAWDFDEHGKFRAGPMSIIPYLEIPAPKELIREICIGPTRNQSLAHRGLSSLIDFKFGTLTSKFGEPKITQSSIPYRQ